MKSMSDKETNELFELLREVRQEQRETATALATLTAQQATLALQVANIQATVQSWMCEGCPMGRRHEVAIKDLQERPVKTLGIATSVSAVMVVIGGFILWLFDVLPHGQRHP